jgi:hypothetical protein
MARKAKQLRFEADDNLASRGIAQYRGPRMLQYSVSTG